MGNWEKHPLSGLQSAYAALDAWVAATGIVMCVCVDVGDYVRGSLPLVS